MRTFGSNGSADAQDDSHPMLALLESDPGHRQLKRGDIVKGVVAMIGAHEMLIDVGGKYEGILASREFGQLSEEDREGLAVGTPVEVMVLNPNDKNGNLALSMAQVRIGQDWEDVDALIEKGEAFEMVVSGHNKGGLIVYLGQVRGFIPVSQLDQRHNVDRNAIDGTGSSPLARFAGQPMWLKIIEVDRDKNRLILSEQAAMRDRRKHLKSELLGKLEQGLVVEGKVTSLADFGAFVDIGGADGLVHLSEISWNRVNHPSDVLKLGQTVKVKVISVDRDRNRIGLSLKQLQPEPWSTITQRYLVGQVVQARVTRLTDFGAFARLEDDVEGLIHASELTDEEVKPETVVQPGDELTVRIIRIDPERKRIGLSLKRAGEAYDQLGAFDDVPETVPEDQTDPEPAMAEA
jgi:small subunit ribosomal protein S1